MRDFFSPEADAAESVVVVVVVVVEAQTAAETAAGDAVYRS